VVTKGLLGLGLALALSTTARAQSAQTTQAAPKSQTAKTAGTSPAFEQACVDLVKGRAPPGGPDAIDALRKACDGLMASRSEAERKAREQAQAQKELAAAQKQQKQGGQAAAGTGAGQPAAGAQGGSAASQGLGGAFAEAGRELASPGRTAGMGMKNRGGPVSFSLTTNPIGWFTGLGINAEAYGPINAKFSWVGGARYSKTDGTNSSVNTFGLEGGADYFLYGKYNEGFRIGPRLEFAFGRQSFENSNNFSWLGLSGEVGYNFIATNGITGSVSGGIGGRVAGDKIENFTSFTGGEFGAYLKVGIGYSW
jgi:hypothetical protein